jgi:AAA domain
MEPTPNPGRRIVKLLTYPTSVLTKLLLLGDSGSGKTGALASLAIAGYNLYILDFDAGLDILKNVLRNHKDATERVDYITCTDQMQQIQGRVVPKAAQAWPKAINSMDNWPGKGNIQTWGEKDILVIDSLNFAGKAALRFIQQMNSRLVTTPWQSDYGDAQRLLENMVAMLYSEAIKCNVIVSTHVREVGKSQSVLDKDSRVVQVEEEGSRKGYAETGTGRALSPTIGRYFNAVLLTDIVGTGQSARRILRTVPHENIGLKNPAPGIVKPEYPQNSGLADYFAAVRGETALPRTAA